MVATVVTHMMISLNSHVGRASNQNANFKKVATIQQFENVTEVKYKSVIEQEQQPPAGAQTFQYNLNESAITISETSLTRLKKAARTINESAIAITEALVNKVKHTITEPATTFTEGITKQRIRSRTISEPSIGIGDSIQKSVKRPKTITEGGTAITEGLTAHKKTFKTLTPESTTITETSLIKVLKKVRLLIEAPTNITEALTHLKTALMSEEPVSITESLVKSKRTVISIDEPHIFLSGVSSSFGTTSFKTDSFTTSISTTENLRAKSIRALSESTTITDSLTAHRVANHLLDIENVPIGPELIQKLVNHILTENVPITEALEATRRPYRPLTEDPIAITESLSLRRIYQRVINPDSFTSTSFTTGAFESFKTLNEDAVEITEELEAFVLPGWQKVITEDPTVITESLTAARTFVRTINEPPIIIGESLTATTSLPVISTGGGGANRRRIRRARYNAYLKSLQPVKIPKATPEPILEHEPLIFEVELTESPIPITETSLTALKIVKEKVIVSVAAAAPPPQIIEKTVYIDRIREKEKLVEIQPPPIIRAQDVIVSKPQPIEIKQDILVSTQSHSNKMKSKAASAQLQILRELMNLSELEEMV